MQSALSSAKSSVSTFILSNFSLNRGFWMAIIFAMICSLALGVALVVRYYHQMEESADNLEKLAAFRLVMDAANRISAERAPTNLLLGSELGRQDEALRNLSEYRTTTDDALALVASKPSLADYVPSVHQALDHARRQVDALVAQPLSERSTEELMDAVEKMFSAYDSTKPLIKLAMNVLLASDAELANRAMVMRMLSELRDYAGRQGSFIVIPMIHNEPMNPRLRDAFYETRGKIIELWQLAAQITETSHDAKVTHAHFAVTSLYMNQGVELFQKTLAESETGHYSITAAEFTAKVVPRFIPLEELRDNFVDATMAELRADAEEAKRSLITVVVATGISLLFEFSLLFTSQKLLFRPLLAARKRIIELADGKLDRPPELADHPQGEIRELHEALASLRVKLIERVALTEKLKRQAETDGLTGVLNRRALDGLGESLAKNRAGSRRVGFIMLDIDHFKRINDTYGHTVGDEVLKETARRLRVGIRQIDFLARFGGEEFAIILGDDGDHAPNLSERLRKTLQDPPFQLDGLSIPVTASFGVALMDIGPGDWPRVVAAADDALYQAKESGRNRVVTRRGNSPPLSG